MDVRKQRAREFDILGRGLCLSPFPYARHRTACAMYQGKAGVGTSDGSHMPGSWSTGHHTQWYGCGSALDGVSRNLVHQPPTSKAMTANLHRPRRKSSGLWRAALANYPRRSSFAWLVTWHRWWLTLPASIASSVTFEWSSRRRRAQSLASRPPLPLWQHFGKLCLNKTFGNAWFRWIFHKEQFGRSSDCEVETHNSISLRQGCVLIPHLSCVVLRGFIGGRIAKDGSGVECWQNCSLDNSNSTTTDYGVTLPGSATQRGT